MHWQYTVYSFPLLGASASLVALAIFARFDRHVPGGATLMSMMLAIAVWSLGYSFEISSADVSSALFWARLEYVGVVSTPFLWFLFAMHAPWGTQRLSWRLQGVLGVVPLLIVILVWTNEFHWLVWSRVHWDEGRVPARLVVTHGVAFWGWVVYAYMALGCGTYLMISALLRTVRRVSLQSVLVFVVVMLPWLGHMSYLLGIGPAIDLTPIAFSLSCLAFALSIFHFRLLGIVPLARDAVIEYMSDGMMVLDTQHRIMDVNPAGVRLLHCQRSSLIGLPIQQVLGAQAAIVTRFSAVAETYEEVPINHEGVEAVYGLRIAPLRDRRGTHVGTLTVWQDITERKHTAQHLDQAHAAAAAANRARESLLTNISHDLRTPLTTIFGYSELIEEQARLSGNVDLITDLRHIQMAGHRLLMQISDILDIADIEAGKMALRLEIFDVQMLVEHVVADFMPMIDRHMNTLTVSYVGAPGVTCADRDKLRQVLSAVISHAARNTQHGLLTLTVTRQPIKEQEWLSFRITDNGVGMTPEQIEWLSQALPQVDYMLMQRDGSINPSLVLSRYFCRMMGGNITITSEAGYGSTFTIYLPAVVNSQQPLVSDAPNMVL